MPTEAKRIEYHHTATEMKEHVEGSDKTKNLSDTGYGI